MSGIEPLLSAFAQALSWSGFSSAALGCFWGVLASLSPGLGPLAGLALLLPFTFGLDSDAAILMTAGFFCGTAHGGSIASILVRVPGEPAASAIHADERDIAGKGRAGAALVIAAAARLAGATVSLAGLALLAPFLTTGLAQIGPGGQIGLILASLGVCALVSRGARPKTLLAMGLGLVVGAFGLDAIAGEEGFSFKAMTSSQEISHAFAALAIGLLSVSEILLNLERTSTTMAIRPRLRDILLPAADVRKATPAIARGSAAGFLLSLAPGLSHAVASLAAYAWEKNAARESDSFGRGSVGGAAAPQAADSASTGAALIPLFAFGVPSIAAMAVLLCALALQGVEPGPLALRDQAETFWRLAAGLYVGDVLLSILALPLACLFILVLRMRFAWIVPVFLAGWIVSVYVASFTIQDAWIMALAGLGGYAMRRWGYGTASLLVAVVLGARLEETIAAGFAASDGWTAALAGWADWIATIASVMTLLAVGVLASETERRKAPGPVRRERILTPKPETSDDF